MPNHHACRPTGIRLAALLGATLFCGAAIAEDHTAAALKHAAEAASSRDSASISQHATEALKHTEAAKAAHSAHPEVVEHIQQGEAALNAADKNAHWFNTDTAAEHADEGKAHLEAAGQPGK